MTYDFCHWDNVAPDTRLLEGYMHNPPLGYYSAISQVCAVAAGESDLAVFPGDTLHDIAPGALLVELAGGVICDIAGRPRVDFYDLSGGTIYATNQNVCEGVARIFA